MRWLIVIFLVCGASSVVAAEPAAQQMKFFETQVRPLLAAKCFKCHGDQKQKGGLRLDHAAAIKEGGESGALLKPGNPQDSLLIQAVKYESFEMPPEGKLSPEQIGILVKWVADGAYWPDEPAVASGKRASGRGITDDDKKWWAFQPLAKVTVPQSADDRWSRNEIDRFLLARLKKEGLSPAPEAARATLIRRLYFDLVGYPPSPDEVAAFVKDSHPQAYEQLVDRLLASERYGERAARHWFDLIRYNESDGYRKDDFRADMWRYRDYVIQSFNADKPLEKFMAEQIAGDELDPDNPEALIATGYWRLYLYEYNQRDARGHWQAILEELTDVTGEVFTGFSIGCAKCHDHKFDPILREDYYRLQAYFGSILPHDDTPVVSREVREKHQRQLAQWEEATKSIRDEIEKIRRPYVDRTRPNAVKKFPPDVAVIATKPEGERSAEERQLMDLMQRQIDLEYNGIKPKEEDKKRLEELQAELAKFDALKPSPLPQGMTVSDASAIPAKTMIPGDKKRREIQPGMLSVLNAEPASITPLPHAPQSTGRRAALARWLTDKDNSLTQRVMVNRVWQAHFGTGIVPTSSDFGHLGELPTHPELLDWLTRYFLDQGSQFKALHRLIVTSAAYRQSSRNELVEQATKLDPMNRWLWRWDVRRLEAEQIRDAMLVASGEIDFTLGGPSVDAAKPRRTIYTRQMRNAPDPLLYAFDNADFFNSTAKRNVTTTPNQSLLMINGSWPMVRSKAFSSRVDDLAAKQPDAKTDPFKAAVRVAWQLAYGRDPDDSEVASAVHFLRDAESTANDVVPTTAHMPVTNSPAADFQGAQSKPEWSLGERQSLFAADFTIEATVQLRSIYPDANVRTIASQWDGENSHRGWNLGVSSAQSKYQPRNLVLQLIGNAGSGTQPTYEVVPSNLRLELNRPYYVAVSVHLADTTEAGVTFYVKDLADPDAVMQTAQAKHQVTSGVIGDQRFVLGDRDSSRRARWDGLIDEVRVSATVLKPEELAENDGAGREVAAHWKFDSTDQPGRDSVQQRHLTLGTPMSKSRSNLPATSLADLCHVLLNSSEFLYVD